MLSSFACLITKAAITEYNSIHVTFFFSIRVLLTFQNLLSYSRYILVMFKNKRVLYLISKLIIVRAVVMRRRNTSVRRTYKWPTPRILLLPMSTVCLFHDIRKVWFLRASHAASGSPPSYKFVRDTLDLHVKRPFVLRWTLNHFNAIFNAKISQGSENWQNP